MKALILIGLQIDLFPLGAAEIADSDKILPVINEQLPNYDHVIAANFSHPAAHKMFVANYPWRKVGQVIDLMGEKILLKNYYCMEGSFGAELTAGFDQSHITHQVSMGTDQRLHPFSAFYDENKKRVTGLHGYLTQNNIDEIHLAGLPFEEVVFHTATDANQLGYKVGIWKKAIAGRDADLAKQAAVQLEGIGVEWL